MGISFMVVCSNFEFQYAIRLCRLAIYVSLFQIKVIMKGFSWKCSNSCSQLPSRWPTPKEMIDVMLISSNSLPLNAFLALFLKTLPFKSRRMSLVAMRMLVDPPIHTDSTQKRRLIGFSALQTPTPLMWHRYKNKEYLQTYLMFSTRINILGLTSPNFKVTYRLMGMVSLSPTTQKWLICSSTFSFSSTTGGSQLILIAFFIHSFLNLSISTPVDMHDNLNPTLLQFMLPASNSSASPQPKLNKQSTSGITIDTILSFSFFHRLLVCRGLPMMICLFYIWPISCMQRLTMGILVIAERM